MISISQKKLIRALSQKKYRKTLGLFVIEGSKIVLEALKSGVDITQIYATGLFIANNGEFNLINNNNLAICSVDEIKSITQLITAPEIIAICKKPVFELDLESITSSQKLTFYLDNIQDPGNLGTIIRLCDWYGIENLLASKDTTDVYGSKVVQASMASIFRVKVHYLDLITTILPKHLHTYSTNANGGDSIHNLKVNLPTLVCIGNEGHGIREEVATLFQKKISIPGNGNAESLNAAMASAIIMDNLVRLGNL
ncbi:MAG: RNA methyltransferase [Bacteroidota bacterium]|nr:RNA methyltransferase [Bacteroidota bacterium]